MTTGKARTADFVTPALKDVQHTGTGSTMPCVTLYRDDAKAIFDMLLVGLSSLAEIDRLLEDFDIHEAQSNNIPDSLRPLRPTGGSDTVAQFAAALRLLNNSIDIN